MGKIRAILTTKLNTKTDVIAINTQAIPVMTYPFNIINWTLAEIKKIDTYDRKLICHRMHHPRADIECLYVERENGGRG